jgi:hypothetical protein
MALESPVDRALGATGTAFRLSRLYPAAHPAVVEALRQVAAALPGLAPLLPLDWRVGVQGLHAQGKQLVPRNGQVAELAGLLYARGIRGIELAPGLAPEHVLALFGVATGMVPTDDATLGRIGLTLSRRSVRVASAALRAESPSPRAAEPEPASAAEPSGGQAAEPTVVAEPPPVRELAPARASRAVFRPDALPADIVARRASQALRAADDSAAQQDAARQLEAAAPDVLALKDAGLVAETIAALDAALVTASDEAVVAAIERAAAALTEDWVVDRLVSRLGEPRVPPEERAAVVRAVGALGAVATDRVVDAYLAAPPELREPFRAAMRAAADRAVEPLERRLDGGSPAVLVAVTQFLGLTGSPKCPTLLGPLVRHEQEAVREAALLGLAELGGRGVARMAVPALKDASPLVRTAAAKAVASTGDPSAVPLLARRAEDEEDEGVLAELLAALGTLGGRAALEVLVQYAEAGGLLRRRTPFVRAAAVGAMGEVRVPEARAMIALYAQDREPTVRRAAEAALQ